MPELGALSQHLVTLAMNGWADADPAWWLNLQAQPDTTVELPDGRFSDHYDGWAALRSGKTAIVVLEPRTGAGVAA